MQVDAAVAQALEEGSAGGAGGLGFEQFASLLQRDEAQLDLYEDMRAAARDEARAGEQARLDGRQGSPAHAARSGCMGCCAS